MKHPRLFWMALLVALATPGFAQSSGSPGDEVRKAMDANPPPSGYQWVYVEELNCGLLQPTGWHLAKGPSGDSFEVVFSEEETLADRDAAHYFRLTFQPGKSLKGKAWEIARGLRDELAKRFKVLYQDDFAQFPFDSHNLIFVNANGKNAIFSLFQGNQMTNGFYTVSFSAPAKDFNEYFNGAGITMVNAMVFDLNR